MGFLYTLDGNFQKGILPHLTVFVPLLFSFSSQQDVNIDVNEETGENVSHDGAMLLVRFLTGKEIIKQKHKSRCSLNILTHFLGNNVLFVNRLSLFPCRTQLFRFVMPQ